MGFYQIKKKNLNNLLGTKKTEHLNTLPKFFISANTFHDPKSTD